MSMNKSTNSNQNQSIPLGIAHTWARIERNLNKSLPELAETLSYPADEISLTRLDNALSTHRLKLPQSVKTSLLIHDGQDVYSRSSVATDGLIWGLWLMSCEEIEIEWGFWRKLDGGQLPGDAFTASDFTSINQNHHHYHYQQQQQHNYIDGNMTSCPAGWVREIYSHPGWLPLLSDRVGNYIGVDLSPPMIIESDEGYIGGGQGNARPAPGQVIAFGREIDEKVVLWRGDGIEGWAHWLAAFADDLEQGNFAHPGGLRPGRRRSNREEEEDSRWQEGDEEDEDEEEGLGEVGYFTGSNGYGVTSDEAEFKGWKLAGEYRGMSIIEALCARSKRRWAEIGLYSSRNPNFPEPTSNPTRSSIASGSSSAVHPKSVAVDQQQPETPIAFVTPPSPRPSTEQTDRLDTFNPTSGLTPRPPTTITRPRRPPPPAPATIALPTMDDMIRAGAEDYDDEHEIEEEESPSPASSVGRFVAAGFRRMSEEVTATSNNARAEEEQIGMSPIGKDKGSRLEDLSLVDQPKET
ncbi:hypothetical protein CROQUDRAFT_106240 [Cronartium quercuum f. sp. fusiforme G11]|uniref:Knr4/Smi1-like domain-containing protein n=1 Tax=Cronartium quercuum f. sp. fusiforme G11 TaxID=708437 RepID=A0A9P6NPB6_9BASI|nr:hypothetical protein CROQUDRAFT_106240 [Cronartium quercuum f. sp. fusiforme G11]